MASSWRCAWCGTGSLQRPEASPLPTLPPWRTLRAPCLPCRCQCPAFAPKLAVVHGFLHACCTTEIILHMYVMPQLSMLIEVDEPQLCRAPLHALHISPSI